MVNRFCNRRSGEAIQVCTKQRSVTVCATTARADSCGGCFGRLFQYLKPLTRAHALGGSVRFTLAGMETNTCPPMTRATVRTLKRALRQGTHNGAQPLQNVALALLSRSVVFGHGRLAVMRLKLAVEAGAQVPHDLWAYCARAACASQDVKVQGLYREAALLATQRHADAAA